MNHVVNVALMTMGWVTASLITGSTSSVEILFMLIAAYCAGVFVAELLRQ